MTKRKKILLILFCLFLVGWIPTPQYSRSEFMYAEACQRWGGKRHAFLFYVIDIYDQCESPDAGGGAFSVGILPGRSYSQIPSIEIYDDHRLAAHPALIVSFSPKGEAGNFCYFSIRYYQESQNPDRIGDHMPKFRSYHWTIDWQYPWENRSYCKFF